MNTKWTIDISKYDGRRWVWNKGWVYDCPMDWRKARDEGGLSLAIIKSSEGTVRDPAFRMNWEGAKGILPRMAYHFFRCNVNPITQVNYQMDLLTGDFDPESDYVACDFETQDGMSGATCLKAMGSFMFEIEKEAILPLLYTYPAFWKQIGGETATWAKKYPLALAQWPLDKYIAGLPINLFGADTLAQFKAKIEMGVLRPVKLAPWDSPALWQFTSRVNSKAIPGHPGIKKAVDYNAVFMPLPSTSMLPSIELPGVPLPVADNRYRCDAFTLKVFTGPGDMYKQGPTPLTSGQIVEVLSIVDAHGEKWAQIAIPAGWVRMLWLSKAK